MTITINGTTGITNDGGYTGDGVVFADTTPANTLVTTTGGNVGIGTSSPAYKFHISSASSSNLIGMFKNTVSGVFYGVDSAGTGYFYNEGTYPILFGTNNTERARIDSSGNLLVGTTSANGKLTVYNPNSGASNAVATWYSDFGSTNNIRGVLRVDGGIANYSANNVNLSDQRLKTNIEMAGEYLEKICAIPVKVFNYKGESENSQRTLGVIAQEVEEVAPELVDIKGFGETPEDGVPLKAIYQTDLQYALMKCIQEQQAIILAQESALNALTARVAALEGTQP